MPMTPPPGPRMPYVFTDLLRRALTAELTWQPFRLGIEWVPLHGQEQPDGASAALLKYAPGSGVPLHEHPAHEWILILSGHQIDARGEYPAGTLVVNTPGFRHAVASPLGCVALIIWERPVKFVT
jgi:anti-sigma factor ChrR (cupin superfamily)